MNDEEFYKIDTLACFNRTFITELKEIRFSIYAINDFKKLWGINDEQLKYACKINGVRYDW